MRERNSSGVDIMLEEWARWATTGILNGLGYSRFSVLGLLVENGGLIIHSSGPKYPPENLMAEEMDKWITDLKKDKPIEADALISYYLSGWIKETIARKLQITVRALEVRIKTAKTWLEGRYAGQKNIY